MSLPSPVHITVAIGLQGNFDSESRVRTKMEQLGLDLTSNVVPHEPHMYFNPAGVENYYRELRHRDLRYFKAKAREIAEDKSDPDDRMEAENLFIN